MAGIQAMATSLKMVKANQESEDLVLAHITSIGEQASEAEEIDVTTLDSPNRAKEFIQGAKDAGSIEVSLNNCFDGQVEALKAVYASGEVRQWIRWAAVCQHYHSSFRRPSLYRRSSSLVNPLGSGGKMLPHLVN